MVFIQPGMQDMSILIHAFKVSVERYLNINTIQETTFCYILS